jgi:uncharacterized protein (TIGR00369 family)
MPVAAAHDPDSGKTEAHAGMTGREFMQAMIDGKIPPPSIAQTMSFRLVEIGDGVAVFEGETGPHLLNPLGTVHGGWVLTLIDSATGCAAHAMLPVGFGITTIETKVNSPARSRRILGACALRRMSSSAAVKSLPPRRASSMRAAAFWRTVPRPSW